MLFPKTPSYGSKVKCLNPTLNPYKCNMFGDPEFPNSISVPPT